MTNQLRTGALAFMQLLADVHRQTEADFEAAADLDIEHEDLRDYASIVDIIAASLRLNVVDADADRREGFMRGLADMFALHVDGAAHSGPFDVLAVTEASFRARRAAAQSRQ